MQHKDTIINAYIDNGNFAAKLALFDQAISSFTKAIELDRPNHRQSLRACMYV